MIVYVERDWEPCPLIESKEQTDNDYKHVVELTEEELREFREATIKYNYWQERLENELITQSNR